jgi:catechol 2,3-dioxygenase-like lactoylglutathione lyase family enzyme
MTLEVKALDHIVVNVADPERSAAWYQRVLGMTREDFQPGPGKAPRISVKFGAQKINLRPVAVSKDEWFTAENEAAGSDDICFLTEAPRRRRWSRTCAAAGSQSRRGRPRGVARAAR